MDGRPHHLIVSHAAPDAYAPMTRAILAKLGYAILLPEEYESLGAARGDETPILRIVDERQLAEVPDDAVALPLIVLTGRHGVTGADSRIVGAVRRPAGMHELFRLIQQVTEETPRSTPRVPTHLHARCRTRRPRVGLHRALALRERLPGALARAAAARRARRARASRCRAPARSRSRPRPPTSCVPDVGMIFHAIPARQREAIAGFVTAALAA